MKAKKRQKWRHDEWVGSGFQSVHQRYLDHTLHVHFVWHTCNLKFANHISTFIFSVEYGLEHILRVINNFVLCWKLCDTLITLNLIDIYERFRLSIHNQTSTYAARVISPQIWHCSTLLTTGPATGRCVFLSNKARVVSGS